MKKITFFALSVFAALSVSSQNVANRLLEYLPAPGQHINKEFIGTPAAAQRMTENLNSTVSLGSFGGYLVLGFSSGCVNHPNNPYGIDFTIFGNAFGGSSEPGVVWVMKDENRNGFPDDTWYEIAGSNHYHSGTRRGYQVTYRKTTTRDIFWTDNLEGSGWIMANQFNLQDYYPSEDIFPGYPSDSVSFAGTLLVSAIDFSNPGEIKVASPAFGYADCHPRVQGVNTSLPDNPYTAEVEGAGGDPVDISWAIDDSGHYIAIDTIHFVKIVSSNLVSAGWLGELSTDVGWVEAVTPQPGTIGKENLLVLFPSEDRMLPGDSLRLEACYFNRGRKVDVPFSFTSSDADVLSVDTDGWVRALFPGISQITVSAGGEERSISVRVVVPDSIQLLTDFSSVYPGDTIWLDAWVYDEYMDPMEISLQYSSSVPAVGDIFFIEGVFCFVSRAPGKTLLSIKTEGFLLEQTVEVEVLSPDEKIRVYLTVACEDENLLPWQWVDIGDVASNPDVAMGETDSGWDGKRTLLQTVIAGMDKAGLSYQFRSDDAAAGKLYLYSVETDGRFYYGWGGKTDPAPFARAWIARLNRRHYLNNFDVVEVSNGDTVALYHVPDIIAAWNYDRLLVSSDSVWLNDEVEVSLGQTLCSWENGAVVEAGFAPVVNARVNAGRDYYTDANGTVVVRIESEPPLVVSSGNNAVLLSGRRSTAISEYSRSLVRLYPNPANTILNIEGIATDFPVANYPDSGGSFAGRVTVLSITGQVVLSQPIASYREQLDVSSLAPGIYQVVVQLGKIVEYHMVVKR